MRKRTGAKKWQVTASVILYIFILAFSLDFDIFKLIDLKLLLLVLFGTVILTFPYCEKGIKSFELGYIFGRKAMEAGFIQTFLLLFAKLQGSENMDNLNFQEKLSFDIAMSFRPLLYGFFIFILLSEKKELSINGESAIAGGKGQEDRKPPDLPQIFEKYGLTKRELEITQLIIKGKSNNEIAAELYISETTVKKHVSNIFEKTKVSKREELICMVMREGQ